MRTRNDQHIENDEPVVRTVNEPNASLTEIIARAVDFAYDGITISDMRLPDEPLIYANEGFERLTGYAVNEILYRNCRFMQGPHTSASDVHAIRSAIHNGREYVGELINYRKDGTPFWNRLSLTPLRNTEGEVTHYVGIQTEITDRVRAEQALQQAMIRLEKYNQELETTNRRMKQSLDAAARVQRAILPQGAPDCAQVEAAWRFRPCDELAGDLLNIFLLDDKHLGFFLLDVTGHGVASALRAIAAGQMLAREPSAISLLWEQGGHTDQYCIVPPSIVADRLNRQFPWESDLGLFFTLVYGVLDTSTGKLRYVSAGHPLPLHFTREGERTIPASAGLPIGLQTDPYEEEEIQLSPGDLLVLYSDGITDVKNGSKTAYGRERLAKFWHRHRGMPLDDALSALFRALDAWRGNSRPADDLSLLTFRIKE